MSSVPHALGTHGSPSRVAIQLTLLFSHQARARPALSNQHTWPSGLGEILFLPTLEVFCFPRGPAASPLGPHLPKSPGSCAQHVPSAHFCLLVTIVFLPLWVSRWHG